MVAIDLDSFSSDAITVWPGIKQIKLTDESVKAIGSNNLSVFDTTRTDTKKTYSSMFNSGIDPLPLHRIYSIDNATKISISRMEQPAALRELVLHEYSSRILSAEPLPPGQMAAAIQLSKRIPVMNLFRDRGLDRLPDLVAEIERDADDSGSTK